MDEQHTFAAVHPLIRQTDGGELILGRADTGVFLALPPEVCEILDRFAEGCSLAETRRRYRAVHGDDPDLQGLIAALAEHAFVLPVAEAAAAGVRELPPPAGTARRHHLTWIPRRWARAAMSPPVLAAGAAVVLLAVAAALARPQVLPGWRALFAPEHLTLLAFFTMGFSLVTTACHELAHLVAAQAAGVDCRLGFGNRLWILVAETDMTGVWGLPRRKRYLPILAGPLLDLVSAAALVLLLFGVDAGWLGLSPLLLRFAQAAFFVYLMRLSWQCMFFVRTDFYYAFASLFGAKNLMQDTEDLLRNRLARARRRPAPVDQSAIAPAEMRVVRAYAWIWLLGRLGALGLLVTVQLPLFVAYITAIGSALAGRSGKGVPALWDTAVLTAVSLTVTISGLVLWFRELKTSSRRIS